jgi:multidrug efflux pump subunit AcrB
MNISEIIFRKKAIFYFLIFCIVIGGILSFRSISKLEDPEIVVMQSQIVTVFPGASAHEVEIQVTNIIEEELNTLENVETIRSQSSPNLSIVTVTLELTVPQDEIEQRWDYLRRRIGEAEAKLPEGVQKPMVYDDFGDVYGMFYAMTADGFSYKDMSRMANYIKREMLAVKGVGKVEIYGEQLPVTDIIISTSKMGEMGVSLYSIISAIKELDAMVYPGTLQYGDKMLDLSVEGDINCIDDISGLLLRGFDGSRFKLGDIAIIKEGYDEPLRNTLFYNNNKAIGISISMESGENIISVGRRVEERLAELKKNIPAGYRFEKVFFQPDKVRESINGFVKNLIASVLTVIVVLMIFMGLRSGFIIGAGLILTILATFPILLAAGGTLQRISLGAFIVAMGMLVDNAVVVIDGILVDLKRGVKFRNALVDPANRTAVPLLGATFIAIAAFFPVYLSEDAAGTYAHDLFVVLCISLLISWILAVTQVPFFAKKMFRKKKNNEAVALYSGWTYRKFRELLVFLLHHRIIVLIVSLLLLALAVFNFQNIKKTFFPDFNYKQVYIEYKLPEGTNPFKVNEDLKRITDYLLDLEEVEQVTSSHGMTPARYCLVRPMGEMSDSYGELIVDFNDYETMMKMQPVVSNYLHDNFPDARTRIRKYNLSIKASHTVEVEFKGPDPAVLRDLSEKARDIFMENPYADPFTVCDDWEPAGHALVARYAGHTARRTGITRTDIANTVLAATEGLPVGEYFEGETRIGIKIKMRNSDGSRIESLEDIPIRSMMPDIASIDENAVKELIYGQTTLDDLVKKVVSPVPLSSVTDGIDLDRKEQVVRRVNGQRAIQVQCEPSYGYSPALVRKTMMDKIASMKLPAGYSMEWEGEQELQGDALRNIFRYLPLSVFLIILTLILLFNDFRKPVIVLACIPMAFVGIVPGMILAGQPFTFMAIIGSFGLMGMIVKNAIVLIDEAEKLIAGGTHKYYAVINATISRTRPVLMASFTTIFGMLPLLGDPMYGSMAVAIISGLLVGTLITLVFVPILYSAFYSVNRIEESKEISVKSS